MEKADDATVAVLAGRDVPGDAAICAVVLSVHSDPLAREAVLSLLEQDVAAEIVVVNTGRGTLRGLLAAELGRIVLVECAERRFAGGARNLGICHSSAPVVAFLASDCLATPGWLRRRLGAHAAGEKLVSSALAPAPQPGGKIGNATWAAFAMTHIGRTVRTSADLASRYGLSYSRDLFARHGLFDEGLRVGEDTAFNRRAAEHHAIGWHPAIVTLHRYPSTLRGAAADQFRRGRRSAAYHRERDGRAPWRHLPHVLLHALLVNRRIAEGFSPPQTRSLPVRVLIGILMIANMVGTLSLYVSSGSSARSARTGRR